MHKIKEKILYYLFVCNVAITSIYLLFSFFGEIKISDTNFTILLIYAILTTIIFSEIVLKNKSKIK
jgi:hypothetical protein